MYTWLAGCAKVTVRAHFEHASTSEKAYGIDAELMNCVHQDGSLATFPLVPQTGDNTFHLARVNFRLCAFGVAKVPWGPVTLPRMRRDDGRATAFIEGALFLNESTSTTPSKTRQWLIAFVLGLAGGMGYVVIGVIEQHGSIVTFYGALAVTVLLTPVFYWMRSRWSRGRGRR